jgi:hypothetical protein
MITGAAGENGGDLIGGACPERLPGQGQVLWGGFTGTSAGVSAAALAYGGMDLDAFYGELLTGGVSGLGFGFAGASATMIMDNYFNSQRNQ